MNNKKVLNYKNNNILNNIYKLSNCKKIIVYSIQMIPTMLLMEVSWMQLAKMRKFSSI